MRKYIGLGILIVALAFIAQWGYTGTVSPPAPIWADFPAVSDVQMDNNSVTNADTVGVNTSINYPDGTTGTTSPQACASGTALNTTGCESFSTSGSSLTLSTFSFALTEVPPNETIEKIYKTPSNDTYTVSRAGVTDNSFSNADNIQLAVRNQYGDLQQAYTTKEDTTTVDVGSGDWIVFSLENNSADTKEITAYAEVTK